MQHTFKHIFFLLSFVFIGFAFALPITLLAQVPETKSELNYTIKYEQELQNVTNHYKELGYDVTPFLNDSRFEIYETLDDRFTNSAEKTSFTLDEYKDILGFDKKAEQIQTFIKANHTALDKAEKDYGIDKFVIAAILGIESNFGANVGNHNPFDVYVSMIVLDYRADFARAQLKHLLIFAQREKIDIMGLKSSYAGAMGFAQFIPYSLNKWWVGKEMYNMENNIYSVANYLAYFKKRVGDIETTVRRYNPSSLYVKAVLDLADVARENYTAAK